MILMSYVVEKHRVEQDQFDKWTERRMNSVGDERHEAGLKILELLADEQDQTDPRADQSRERQHD